MNDSLAQHSAQTPSPSTGSRQATQSVGSAMSSASRAACTHPPRHAFSAPRRWVEMERDGDASASMSARLASGRAALKPAASNFRRHCEPAARANARPDDRLREAIHNPGLDCFVASLLAMTFLLDRVAAARSSRIPGLTVVRYAGESPAGRRAEYGPRNRAGLRAAYCRKSRNPQARGC